MDASDGDFEAAADEEAAVEVQISAAGRDERGEEKGRGADFGP